MAAYDRRSFTGAATATTLSSSIISGDTSISITDATGWPTGSGGDFFVVIDRGNAAEEVVRIDTRSTLTLTVAASGRGSDGTTAVSHASGATIEHCLTAFDLDEANAHLSNQQADPHPMYLTAAEGNAAYLTPATAASTYQAKSTFPVCLGFALSDEISALTTGTAKLTVRAPFAFTLTGVKASLSTASGGGTLVTVDINESGSTVLSTKLTIDNSEKTSATAATAAVISDSSIALDAEITFDIDQCGSGAKGLKVWLLGTRAA
jgi:hypothetical protein